MNRNGKDNVLNEETLTVVRAVLEATAGISWLTDDRARVVVCNRAAEMLTGRGRQLPVLDGPKVSIDLAELVLSAGADGKAIRLAGLELALKTVGREEKFLAQLRIVPLELAKDWPGLYLVNLACYDNPRELAIQNAENEKLTSLTGLAAKIAHELNNPLDGSMRYIKLAQRRLEQGTTSETSGKISGYLSSAQEALGKINGILSDLARFARHGQSNLEAISVNDLVEQAVRTLSARASLAGVSIVTMLAEDLPRAGGPKLYQVFCNLLKNAIDAVVEKRQREPQAVGRITITTAGRDGNVLIRFEDTGTGLPEKRQCLFDPFFTTKAPDEGTGLGLAISKEIIQQYHGKISAADGKNGGACFSVELPPIGDPACANQRGL